MMTGRGLPMLLPLMSDLSWVSCNRAEVEEFRLAEDAWELVFSCSSSLTFLLPEHQHACIRLVHQCSHEKGEESHVWSNEEH